MSSQPTYMESPTVPLIHRHKMHTPDTRKSGLMGKIRDFLKQTAIALSDTRGLVTVVMVCTLFFVGWRAAGILLNCENPLVVVLSGSMEPAYYRGDLLLLHKATPITISDVIVFSLPNRTVPIVHRVHRMHEDGGVQLFLTKGDNNEFDDRTLYPDGYQWVKKEDIIGKVFLIIPHAGFLTLIAEDKPWFKGVVLIASLLWGWMAGV
ncbi:signal peptidase type I [Trypanosoma theileri]|uniref:Signal peptidase complex catalytic subunit SEC11 n=1 Tax=Trypanosoma theileri TaxID=67003 RepID=A0A1X0NPP1_9TRYP|nr:signal peptidase type I [Trypanosoma theileri]ORC86453.1 signal peptidase type I [Trypanosoma theileri]